MLKEGLSVTFKKIMFCHHSKVESDLSLFFHTHPHTMVSYGKIVNLLCGKSGFCHFMKPNQRSHHVSQASFYVALPYVTSSLFIRNN
jgi:hypothetical protein